MSPIGKLEHLPKTDADMTAIEEEIAARIESCSEHAVSIQRHLMAIHDLSPDAALVARYKTMRILQT
ncbi:MAG: hypothetical protein KKF27_21850 [Gammaproteobacteria bacterium]|nr:hypothetical protein [Gammaproteobacteria bacterium]